MADAVPILILAAGSSSRLAPRDKLAEPVGGVPLLTRIASAALETGAPVYVALPAAEHPRAVLVPDRATVLAIPQSGEGMGGTIREAVSRLPLVRHFMVVAADLPEIGRAEFVRLLEAPEAMPDALIWRGATADGRPGHPILFDARLRSEFATLGGDEGARAVVARHRDRVHLVPLPRAAALRDLDTPEDWAAFRAETGL